MLSDNFVVVVEHPNNKLRGKPRPKTKLVLSRHKCMKVLKWKVEIFFLLETKVPNYLSTGLFPIALLVQSYNHVE